MNAHALLAARVVLTVAVLAMLAGMVVIESFYPPGNPLAQRVLDLVTGGLLTLLTGSCYAWFFGSTAGAMQANATIADQSRMLAQTIPTAS